MAIATVQFSSLALQQPVHYSILLPETGSGPYPVLLQLHGHGDNYQSWLHYTRLAYYARDVPMIIVLPDGGTSFYLNLDEPASFRKWHSQQYERFLIQDLRQHITSTYHAQAGRWAIGGNSMGGYGAMRLGCKYPHLFASIYAHSGTYYSADELEEVVPNHEDADVFATITKLASSNQRDAVNIVFDCGKDDISIEYSRQLQAHMHQLELPYQYIEQAGDHSWDYWDQQIPQALEQHRYVLQSEV